MTYTVKYKLDKSKLYTIKVPSSSTVEDLLKLVSKKHKKNFITVYSKSYLAFLDPDDNLSDYPPSEDDAIYFISEKENFSPDDFDGDEEEDADTGKEESSSSKKSDSEDDLVSHSTKDSKKEEKKGSKKKAIKRSSRKLSSDSDSEEAPKHETEPHETEYPTIPSMEYPSIPTIAKEKPLDDLLVTNLTQSFRFDYKSKEFLDDSEPDEFYVYSTKDYHSMTEPTKVTLPLNSTYDSTVKEIRKSLDIKKDLQIHIYLPSGVPFVKKYGRKKETNKLSNFFNQVEDSKHVLYAIITSQIDQNDLDEVLDEVCNAKDDKMKKLICPICSCNSVGYSRMACLLGTFYYRGLQTFNFINSVARCTGFAPLVSCLSSMLYHEPITGLMLATVTASLHTLFSKLLPKSIRPEDVFTRCLECACFIVHIDEAYNKEKKKDKKKSSPEREVIQLIDIDKDDKTEFISYLQLCGIKGAFYQYLPDVDDSFKYDIAILDNIPNFKIIEDIFNKYASYRPIPPLSVRLVNVTCIIRYVRGQTLLHVISFDKDGTEEKINIIDPFVGEVTTTDFEKLASDVEEYSINSAPLIEAEDVEELIVILFDISGSMLSEYDKNRIAIKRKYDRSVDPPKPIPGDTNRFMIATQYLITFLNRSFGFKLPQLVSLVSFNNSITELCDFTPLGYKIETAATKIRISGKSRVWDALDFSITKLNEFNKDKKYPNAKPRILIFSDGIDLGSEKKQEYVCQRAIDSNIIVDSVIVSLVDSCENLCKFSHLTGGYSLRTEDINDVNSLFEKEAFLSLKLRPEPEISKKKITEEVFAEAYDQFDKEVDNYDFITKTHMVRLSTPNYVMSQAKKSKTPIDRYQLRILREMKKFQLENDETIKLYINANDINNWKVYMLGPEGTLYAKHWWYLSITFTSAYPIQPPLFRFISVPYHLNISEDGRVCAHFLGNSYRASYSVYELVNKVKDLLKNPEVGMPISIYKRMLYQNRDEYDDNVAEDADSSAPKDIKTYLKGSTVDDDPKFKVGKDDFESNEKEMPDDLDAIFEPDVPRPVYHGPTLIDEPLPGDIIEL